MLKTLNAFIAWLEQFVEHEYATIVADFHKAIDRLDRFSSRKYDEAQALFNEASLKQQAAEAAQAAMRQADAVKANLEAIVKPQA